MFGGYKSFFDVLDRQVNLSSDKSRRLSYLDSKSRIISLNKINHKTGITTRTELRLAIIGPAQQTIPIPAKSDIVIYQNISHPGLFQNFLKKFKGLLAVDIETNGLQAADPNIKIYGIGIASLDQVAYFDFGTNSEEANQAVLDWLTQYADGLVGHNVMFDGTFLLRDTGVWLDWKYDTYALYRQLANEGHKGHSYGLKQAQIQLLGWQEKGDIELDQWLISNGHISDTKKQPADGYHKGKPIGGEARYYKARKDMMYLAPAKVLGYYCGLDAYSTLMLYMAVFNPAMTGQYWEPEFRDYHRIFLRNVQLLANQQLTGITIDKLGLEGYRDQLKIIIEKSYQAFINHPKVREYADILNQRKLDEHINSEPAKFKKQKPLGICPKQYTKSGAVSKNYLKYQERKAELEATGPELTVHWVNWSAKLETLKTLELFNANSPAQLQELFYKHLGFPVLVWTDNEENPQPSTGVDALPGFGEVGALLDTYREKEKELGYVQACLDNLILHMESDTKGAGMLPVYRLHPQFRAPGTLTCRLAGSGGVNLQQIPKTPGYLEHWRPKPGKVWIDFDFAALEQVVMAELARCPTLFKVYGPEARPGNDVYLFNGSQLPVIGEAIREAGYDPDTFTPETVSAAKKIAKKPRAIAKQTTLSSIYGAGVDKLYTKLRIQGVDCTREEIEQVHRGYWELYSKVKKFGYFLQDKWRENNGYVLNGIGRPVCCAIEYKKDMASRVVQSTGHDLLMIWVDIYSKMLDTAGINWDAVVLDFHDETIIEVDAENKDKTIQIFKDSIIKLNEKLGGEIPLSIDGGQINNLAEAKCLDDYKDLIKARENRDGN